MTINGGAASRPGKLWALIAAACILLVTLIGCGGGSSHEHAQRQFTFSGTHPIKVTCTTGQVADIVREVGKPHVQVQHLMHGGTDPHLYEASLDDLRRIRKADIVFYSGLHLEGKMVSILESHARRHACYAVTADLEESRLLGGDANTDGGMAHDPHVWFDVPLWAECVKHVGEVLAEFDAAHAGDYIANATRYAEQLMRLHEEIAEKYRQIPEAQRVLITAHDAFGYLGRRYGLDVRGIQGLSTEAEAGVGDIKASVDVLVERNVKAVFVESSVPERFVHSLIAEARNRGHEVTVGGELYSDGMGQPGSAGETYVGMVRHNAKTIVEALKWASRQSRQPRRRRPWKSTT